ncbi:hypothetical protein PGB90_004358 [Kerria lacca]
MREDKYTNSIYERRTSIKSTNSVPKNKQLKVTTVGDGMVGKTCMLITYTVHQFPKEYIPTVFDNFPLSLTIDGIEYDVTLWDTAGQEDYERLRPLSYTNTDCFLLCFSIGNRSSFDNIVQKWYPELKHYCPKVPIILIGTKSDLRETGDDVVSNGEGKKLKNKIHAAKYMECSALKNQGLDEIFVESVKYSIQKYSHKKQSCIFL